MTTAIKKGRKTFKVQAVYAAFAVVAAVLLPQLFHVMGAVSGVGTALGEIFLPMHLPVILVGLLAGAYAGVIAGAISPLISFALTGMPTSAMLPFITVELVIYGLCAGILRNVKMPTVCKVLIAQVAGRAVRAVAILIAAYGFASTAVPVAIIWKSIATGVFGIALQWALLPLIVYRVENGKSHE